MPVCRLAGGCPPFVLSCPPPICHPAIIPCSDMEGNKPIDADRELGAPRGNPSIQKAFLVEMVEPGLIQNGRSGEA